MPVVPVTRPAVCVTCWHRGGTPVFCRRTFRPAADGWPIMWV